MAAVVTIATNKRAYGEMAYNLAVSLKAHSKKIPFIVISDGRMDRIPGWENVVDEIITVQEGFNPFELKTRVYSLMKTEFLFVDADSAFIGDVPSLFRQVQGKDFCMMEYERHPSTAATGTTWASIGEIFSHYGLSESALFPEYNSSVFWAKKTEANDRYFKAVHDAYAQSSCRLVSDVGGYFPDEVAFGVASARLNHYSEISNWEPAFLQRTLTGNPENLGARFPLITLSGANCPPYSIRNYQSTVNAAARELGISAFRFDKKQKVHYSR